MSVGDEESQKHYVSFQIRFSLKMMRSMKCDIK